MSNLESGFNYDKNEFKLRFPYEVLSVILFIAYQRYMHETYYQTALEMFDDKGFDISVLIMLIMIGFFASLYVGGYACLYIRLIMNGFKSSTNSKEDIKFMIHATLLAAYVGIGYLTYHLSLCEASDGYKVNNIMIFLATMTVGLIVLNHVHKLFVMKLTEFVFEKTSEKQHVTSKDASLDESKLLSKLDYGKANFKQTIRYVVENAHHLQDVELLHRVDRTLIELPEVIDRFNQLSEVDKGRYCIQYESMLCETETMFNNIKDSIDERKREAFEKAMTIQKKRMS